MELATVNDANPCGDRGLDAVCPPVALDRTKDEKWRRWESNLRQDDSICLSPTPKNTRHGNQMSDSGCVESPNSPRCSPILLISDRYRLDILRLSLFR